MSHRRRRRLSNMETTLAHYFVFAWMLHGVDDTKLLCTRDLGRDWLLLQVLSPNLRGWEKLTGDHVMYSGHDLTLFVWLIHSLFMLPAQACVIPVMLPSGVPIQGDGHHNGDSHTEL